MDAPGISQRLNLAEGDVFFEAGSRAELEERAPAALASLKPGGRLWVAYLADGSADLNRNHGWGALQRAGMTATDEVNLDERWTAVLFMPLAATPGAAIPGADMLPVGRRASPLFRVVRIAALPLLHLLFRFDVRGRERLPSTAYVLIANHLGWMDAISLLILFPAEPRIHFLADPTSMMRNRPLWLLVRGAGGVVPVDRAQKDHTVLFAQVGKCLERGGVVALFPEGDFGPGEGQVLPFKKGFAHFAIDGRVPVVPVGMSGMKELWLGKRLHLRIGEAISTDGKTVDEVVKLGQDAVTLLLPEYRDPGGRRPLRRWLTGLF